MDLVHRTTRGLSRGLWYPLGASLSGDGVNFALYSRSAEEVWLLLFDAPDGDPTDVIRLTERTRFTWHVLVHGLKAGQLYGYRVGGPFDPRRGLRFNDNKLLIDPYAKALTGKARGDGGLLLGYDPASPLGDLSRDTRDDAPCVPKGIVVDDAFDWQGDRPPAIPFESSFVYEVHVKGFTAHPSSRVTRPGTYLGFIEKIPHLVSLGITAVELLPVHETFVDDSLLRRGLTNYWGYNTIGFFTPESSFASGARPGCQVDEFKTLVRELHRAGIEVILDVVYNHTAEGSELGPTLSFRGIDNPTYYTLTGPPDQPGRYYMNETGCGNGLDLSQAPVIRLVMDSLRYWVEVMHVDGFRFDLASVLGREYGAFRGGAPFFDAVSQDPVLCRVKLIAEPWDLGTYQVGNFPVNWAEWNGRFRDTARRFMKGDAGQVRDLGWRLTGSADLYGDDGRSAWNSINFVTCHDGFTLRDLVTYNGKHNEANLEGSRDGTDDNNSWNCGIEGETSDPGVNRLRRQMVRNHACLLLFACGTPMILGGDEIYRTQAGNNNAYCQDGPLTWFDWDEAAEHAGITLFFRQAIALCRRYPILQRRKFLLGEDLSADHIPDIEWYGADLRPPVWDDSELRTLCYQLNGGAAPGGGRYRLFLILNADWRPKEICLPALSAGWTWRRIIDTGLDGGEEFSEAEPPIARQDLYVAPPRAFVVLVGR